jgi:hypothetical protein
MKITIFIVLIVLILFFILVIGYFRFIHYRNLSKETFSENRNRVAIITSIYGNYDDLKIQNIKNKDLIDWYCFTDNKGVKSDTWKIINTPYHLLNEKYEHKNYKNSFSTLVKNENSKKTLNMMSAKYYKMKGHEIDILKNYDK